MHEEMAVSRTNAEIRVLRAVVTSANFINGRRTEVKERTEELVFMLLALLDGKDILRKGFWNLLHTENIRHCFSVCPVVGTSDDVEWAENV